LLSISVDRFIGTYFVLWSDEQNFLLNRVDCRQQKNISQATIALSQHHCYCCEGAPSAL
jgi:hypothetical protein